MGGIVSTIAAGTTLTTAFQVTGDTNGNLIFKTGASGTTALTISATQVANFANPIQVNGATPISGAQDFIVQSYGIT